MAWRSPRPVNGTYKGREYDAIQPLGLSRTEHVSPFTFLNASGTDHGRRALLVALAPAAQLTLACAFQHSLGHQGSAPSLDRRVDDLFV